MTTLVEALGEKLSRTISRRTTLETAAKAAFAAVAGVAAGGLMGSRTAYAYSCQDWSGSCFCSPPRGVYCSSCNGENCGSGCSFDYGPWPGTACWCTQTCCNFNCSSRGYYKCCDCNCSGNTCGCASWVTTCGPCGAGCC